MDTKLPLGGIIKKKVWAMKKILLFLAIIIVLSGCKLSTPENIEFDEWEIGGEYQNLRSAHIEDVILYDCGEYGTYIKKGQKGISQKIEELSGNFAISKISASDQYFYISGKEISDVWGGKCNVLIMDINGKVIGAKDCCCEWVYVCGNTVLGYYTGRDEFDVAEGWAAKRIEATHSMDEKKFFENQDDDISKWKVIIGDRSTINGKKLFRQKDSDHAVPYYTDAVYYDAYDVLDGIIYVDGSVESNTDREAAQKYIEQLQKIMGDKEKNFEVSAWQFGDKLFGVCCVYGQSGGFLQHFTKDIECSLWFGYNPDKDSIYLEETYHGKEVAYCDENWMIYRKDSAVYIENLKNHNRKKVFESDVMVNVDLTDNVVTLWDVKNEELNHSDAVILQ